MKRKETEQLMGDGIGDGADLEMIVEMETSGEQMTRREKDRREWDHNTRCVLGTRLLEMSRKRRE